MEARLVPMTQAQWEGYQEPSIADYAAEKVKAGNWTAEEAPDRSRQEHNKLLPQGVDTPNNHLYVIEDQAGEAVGWLWIAVEQWGQEKMAFIYNIQVEENQRRKGYGRQAMLLGEEEARRLDCRKIALHVFGYNQPAIALYQSLGYHITNINMAKVLEPL